MKNLIFFLAIALIFLIEAFDFDLKQSYHEQLMGCNGWFMILLAPSYRSGYSQLLVFKYLFALVMKC